MSSDMSQSSNVPSTESQLAAPPLIPWRYAFIVTGGLAVVSTLGIFVAAAAGALAAAAGYMIGTYTSMNGGYGKAMAVGAIVALAGGASLQFDSVLTIVLASLLLLALASWESVRVGSRDFVMGLLAYLMFTVGIDFGNDWLMLIAFIVGVAVGIIVIVILGIPGSVPSKPVSWVASVALGAFLAIGLSISVVIMEQLDEPRSYLIALIFVGRALIPFEGFRGSTLRYGIGAITGSAVAFGILIFSPPSLLTLGLALLMLVFGIRNLTHRLPIAPATITAAVLLALQDSQQDIFFRIFTVVIVVALALSLSLIIEWLWRLLSSRFPRQVPRFYQE
jgi:hypothetical protein